MDTKTARWVDDAQSGKFDPDSGTLEFRFVEYDSTPAKRTTVRFIEVETLLTALARIDSSPGLDRFNTESFREYWRMVLTEKLDAHEL